MAHLTRRDARQSAEMRPHSGRGARPPRHRAVRLQARLPRHRPDLLAQDRHRCPRPARFVRCDRPQDCDRHPAARQPEGGRGAVREGPDRLVRDGVQAEPDAFRARLLARPSPHGHPAERHDDRERPVVRADPRRLVRNTFFSWPLLDCAADLGVAYAGRTAASPFRRLS